MRFKRSFKKLYPQEALKQHLFVLLTSLNTALKKNTKKRTRLPKTLCSVQSQVSADGVKCIEALEFSRYADQQITVKSNIT